MSFPPATEMFQFAGCRPARLCIQRAVTSLRRMGCPIRKSSDQSVCAASRGLSQLAASFVACRCQGIHHMPFMLDRQKVVVVRYLWQMHVAAEISAANGLFCFLQIGRSVNLSKSSGTNPARLQRSLNAE